MEDFINKKLDQAEKLRQIRDTVANKVSVLYANHLVNSGLVPDIDATRVEMEAAAEITSRFSGMVARAAQLPQSDLRNSEVHHQITESGSLIITKMASFVNTVTASNAKNKFETSAAHLSSAYHLDTLEFSPATLFSIMEYLATDLDVALTQIATEHCAYLERKKLQREANAYFPAPAYPQQARYQPRHPPPSVVPGVSLSQPAAPCHYMIEDPPGSRNFVCDRLRQQNVCNYRHEGPDVPLPGRPWDRQVALASGLGRPAKRSAPSSRSSTVHMRFTILIIW